MRFPTTFFLLVALALKSSGTAVTRQGCAGNPCTIITGCCEGFVCDFFVGICIPSESDAINA
ncbi:hypothetical protein B0H19DRAFT_1262472 [Mycena capillaripes]|nr:hypothetical protein B0H19DRAFT_1262472 [Mycena capillaripes]